MRTFIPIIIAAHNNAIKINHSIIRRLDDSTAPPFLISTIRRVNTQQLHYSTIRRFDNSIKSTIPPNDDSTTSSTPPFHQLHHSTIRQLHHSTIRRFDDPTIQQLHHSTIRRFDNSSTIPPPHQSTIQTTTPIHHSRIRSEFDNSKKCTI